MCHQGAAAERKKRKATRIKEGGGMMGNMNLTPHGSENRWWRSSPQQRKKSLLFFALLSSSSSTLLFYSPFLLVLALPRWQVCARNNIFSFLLLFLWQKKREPPLHPRGLRDVTLAGRGEERRWGAITTASRWSIELIRKYEIRKRGGLPCFPLGFAFCKTRKTTPR